MTDEERLNQIREYAWNWFSYHAAQRTSMFNYFLVSVGLLASGFAAALSKQPHFVATGIAALGLLISVCFLMLDVRNEALVAVGKNCLMDVERALFRNGTDASIALATFTGSKLPFGITSADDKKNGKTWFYRNVVRGKHRVYLRVIEFVSCAAFGVAVLISWPSYRQRNHLDEKSDAATVAESIKDVAAALTALKEKVGAPPAPPIATKGSH